MTSDREHRTELIGKHILGCGSATIPELVALFEVSPMTIHRDLAELERQSLVRRFRGGASAQASTIFESSLLYRSTSMRVEKEAIAREVAGLIEPGSSVTLDEGSTALRVAEALCHVGPLTVITHSLPAINVLKESRDIRLVGVGGAYSHAHEAFLGIQCVEAVGSMQTDILVLSTSAVSSNYALHQEQAIVEVKRAMMANAVKRILCVDSTKFGKSALHRVAPLTDFDLIITDSGITDSEVEALTASGVPHRIVELNTKNPHRSFANTE